MKSTIFVGSSKEALPLAKAIKGILSADFDVDIWNENLFELGEDALTGLLRFVNYYDFGLLVITEDDLTVSRKTTSGSPRDNVILELGMFIGALGKRRSFPVVCPSIASVPKEPSDLLGITQVYLSRCHLPIPDLSILREDLKLLMQTLRERSLEAYLDLLPSTGLAIGYFENFVVPTCHEIANMPSLSVGGRSIDITPSNFDFTIVLPRTLSDASIAGARKFFASAKVEQIVIQLKNRSYPTYVSSEIADGRVKIFDFPTTLRASHEAVRIALAGQFLGNTRHHASLDRKEIANFEKTLNILLQKPEVADVRDNIKIIQMS